MAAIAKDEHLKPGQERLYLKGLSCADCAAGIESAVRSLPGVASARLDFVTQKMTIVAENKRDLPALVLRASKIATDIEPDIRVSYTEKESAEEHSDDRGEISRRIRLAAGAALFFSGILFDWGEPWELVLFLSSYVLVGGDVVLRALKNLSKREIFDEHFLMSCATIGAFVIGEYSEGVAVMLFYQIGETFQRLAVDRSRRNIAAMMNIRPDFANVLRGETILKVSPDEVAVGDMILVKPGEKIPLDGQIAQGYSALDISALTGESLPRDAAPGDEVFSGAINLSGALRIRVSKLYKESTVSKILELVENAGSKKAPTENFMTKFAHYYTPVVFFAAIALAVIPPLILPGALFSDWLYRALAFLVVSCPCALVISIPLTFFGGIGGAARRGILVKGGNYLEALNNIDTIVFDKTGTLTKGRFDVTRVNCLNGFSEAEVLSYAAHAEGFSNHPIALSLQRAHGPLDLGRVSAHTDTPGRGIRAQVDLRQVLAGNASMMEEEGIAHVLEDAPGSVVFVAVDGLLAGSILISDEPKPDSKKAIRDLKTLGVRHTAMFTGDSRAAGEAIGHALGLDRVYTELMPHRKVEQLELLQKEKETKGLVVFVGDGINDAPVLKRADIGIAMGALGADAAIEAADIVLLTDEPSKIVTAIRVARKTRRIALQNIFFAVGVKTVVLILAALGHATLWQAVFGDMGVTLIAIFNAMRVLTVSKQPSSRRTI